MRNGLFVLAALSVASGGRAEEPTAVVGYSPVQARVLYGQPVPYVYGAAWGFPASSPGWPYAQPLPQLHTQSYLIAAQAMAPRMPYVTPAMARMPAMPPSVWLHQIAPVAPTKRGSSSQHFYPYSFASFGVQPPPAHHVISYEQTTPEPLVPESIEPRIRNR